MRPQPLACWLVGEWLHEQGTYIKDLISDLSNQPRELQESIIGPWAKRLEFMQGNHDAEHLYDELLKVGEGPFANEDVIYSDLGSRLILAMCTVNPVAVINCLYDVLYQLPIDVLKSSLKDNARRNIVRTIEKLCFCKDCFEKAACLLARLAIAENEDWANNSRGQFLHLFQIALAGTESDLNARINVIGTLYREKRDYHLLLLEAIRGAFNCSHFNRMRGAEKFGFIEKHDFQPTWAQIYDYWDGLYDILSKWVDEYGEDVKSIADIICYNTRMFIHAQKSELLFQFIDLLVPKLNNCWNEMHKSLIETKNYDKVGPVIEKKIDSWLEKLAPQDILGRMKNAVHDVYTKGERGSDILKQEDLVVQPFVDEFIEKRAYLTDELFQLLDLDSTYISWSFTFHLAEKMPNEDISKFCDHVEGYIIKQDQKYYSPFLVKFFTQLNNKNEAWNLAHHLFDAGYINMAIPIFAVTDNNEYSQLSFVMQKALKGDINSLDVSNYFSAINLNNVAEILRMSEKLRAFGADESLLINFISHYWYEDDIFTDSELIQFYQQVVLNYEFSDNRNYNSQLIQFIKSLLEKTFDPKFVMSLNTKLITYLSSNQSLSHVEELYEVLLTDKYRDLIWEDFSAAFTDLDNRVCFFLNVKDVIGSGFGFGEKVLFLNHIDQMKQLCKDFKDGAVVCAATCPVFDVADPASKTISSFHPFVIWLFENYGVQKSVLDEFHSNLYTFSWTGSTLSLIEVRKSCFENLKLNKNLSKNVYGWIDSCLQANTAEYERENQREAYNRLSYGNH